MMVMDEICAYLKNWFIKDMAFGEFAISDGRIRHSDGSDMGFLEGQYYRIIDSTLNDGVWVYHAPSADPEGETEEGLKDENFKGAVWYMAVPPNLIALAGEIAEWQKKNGAVDSPAMSPFNSESFGGGGYSYSKAGGYGSSDSTGNAGAGWQNAYAARLARWRKL